MLYRIAVFALFGACITATTAAVYHVLPGESVNSVISTAVDGDTVILEDGTHFGPIVPYGRSLVVASRFALDGDTSHVANTIVEPAPEAADTASCVVYTYGEDDNSRLVGLTLENGRGTYWDYANNSAGGAIFVRQSHVQISSCIITHSNATHGGGIAVVAVPYSFGAGARIARTQFQSCNAFEYGGGIFGESCSLRVSLSGLDTLIAGVAGGAMHLHLSRIMIDSSSISRCCAAVGGIDATDCSGAISNSLFWANGMCGPIGECDLDLISFTGAISGNTFRENRNGWPSILISGPFSNAVFIGNLVESNHTNLSTGSFTTGRQRHTEVAFNMFRDNSNVYGGAVYCYDHCDAWVHHNTFTGNTSDSVNGGSVVQSVSFARPLVEQNIITENRGQTVSSYYESRVILDARNNWWGHESGPYHAELNPLGQGDTLVGDSVLFEPWLTSPPDTTQPSAIRPDVERPVAGTWDLQSVFPNPFNNAFTLSLAGFAGRAFEISLFDILGRRVATLHSGPAVGGLFTFTVSPELGSGVYFVAAHDDLVRESIKVVLLK